MYPCDKCDFSAYSVSKLNQHKKSKHEGIRYPCDQCDYSASILSSLNKHRRSKHEGIRYPCDQCKYSTAFKSALTIHRRSKHEGFMYQCVLCDFSASSVWKLKQHKRTMHEINSVNNLKHYDSTILGNIKKLVNSLETQDKVKTEEPVFIEVSDTDIKKEDITEEDPLSDAATTIITKHEIDIDEMVVKEEIEDFYLETSNENVKDTEI